MAHYTVTLYEIREVIYLIKDSDSPTSAIATAISGWGCEEIDCVWYANYDHEAEVIEVDTDGNPISSAEERIG